MAPRGGPVTFRPSGVTDAVDGSNAPSGSMAVLTNLIPSPATRNQFVPRPASIELINIASSLAGSTFISALLVIGTRAYGMIASNTYAGKDEPFCYDIENDVMVSITGQSLSNLPTSPATSGEWQPPKMAQVGGRILVTHPGFSGGAGPFFGWIDISGFSLTTMTGNTNSNTTINSLSSSAVTAQIQPGMSISGTDIPAGTTITAVSATALTISQAATGTSAGVALTIAGGTFAAPVWGSGNTSGTALVDVPKSVAQFNNRAWFAVDNTAVYSDALYPTYLTAATQVLTIGDSQDVTALAGLPLTNQLGGIIGSLIAFKGDAIMFQITGDPTTNDLALNSLNIAVGTLAPNTICPTPLGLAFIAGDGLRILTFAGVITPVIGANGEGVNVPFINADQPSRMCASFNQDVLRISVKNGAAAGNPWEDYWYHFALKKWSGPHSFPAALLSPYHGATNNGFIVVGNAINAKLWTGPVTPDNTSTYTENGSALSWIYQTSLLADTDTMRMNAVNLTMIGMALPSSQSCTVQALDEQGGTLGSVVVTGSGQAPALWGTGVWGSMVWGTGGAMYQQHQIEWTAPLVFKQMTIRATGAATEGFVIGNVYFEFQRVNYLMQAS